MIDGARSIRFTGPRLAAGALVIGLASFAVSALPATSRNAAASTSVRNTALGALLATLYDPAATADDAFGSSVAVSGTTAVVGAYGTNSGAGEAYIYVKDAAGWPTTPTTTLLNPGGASVDFFGDSVAVSGTTVIVGAENTNSDAGAAYIYVKGASGWPTNPTVTLSQLAAKADDAFGSSVAVSGTTAVVGAFGTYSAAGAAYIYVKGASGWPKNPTTSLALPPSATWFGISASVSGNTAAVGAKASHSFAGTAYIYVKGTSGWPKNPTTTLKDPAARAHDYFGASVAVSGQTAVVGADENTPTGAAYIYVKGASGWPTKPTAKLSDPAANPTDGYGVSAAVSGETAIVGAFGSGSNVGDAYIYTKGVSGWPKKPTATLLNPGGTADDAFGDAVALSGTTSFVGSPGTNSGAGAAYIYKT